jgi:3-methyladenine DNA glycosylase/8-oxoguanine DNA glycosylase
VPTLRVTTGRPLDLAAVVGPLYRGSGDPTMRLARARMARASWMPSGPATLLASLEPARGADTAILAEAWGPGADEALERLPALLGLDDDDRGFDPSLHPLIAELARRRPGVRIGRTGSVFEALVPAVLEQRITGTEAFRGYRRLIRALEIPAPGPLGLWMPPRAADVAGLPSWTFPGLGIEPRRGALLRRLARDAPALEKPAQPARLPGGGGAGAAALESRLRAYPGIGPWTSAEVRFRALGDPDAVSLGDFHLPHLVAWALAGGARGTDERMLELLAPWPGHRARVVRLIELSGLGPPRRGPRLAARDLVDLAPRR